MFRRRIAAVLPNWANTLVEFASNRIHFETRCDASSKYKRSLVSDQGVFSQLTLTACCNPQRSGECGNYDGGERSDGPIVMLQEGTEANNEILQSRYFLSGLIFFVGTLIALLFAAYRWWRLRP